MGLISKIEDKLSGNKSSNTTEEERLREQQGLGSSGTHNTTSSTGGLTGQGSHLGQQSGTTTSGLTGTHQTHGTHNTTTGSHNPLSSGNNTHQSSGITGGTHPLVSGQNTSHGVGQTHGSSGLTSGQHNTSGLTGQGSHFAGHDNVNTHGSGLTGNTHSSGLTGNHNETYGSGLTGNTHSGTGIGSNTHNSGLTGSSHTGTGLGHNTHHTGSGITGGTAVGSDVGSRDYAPGTHTQGTHHGISSSEKTTARQPFDPYSSKGQNIAANAAHEGHHNTHNTHHTGTGIGSNTHHTSTSGNHEGAGFVPGSHPHANNDSAIPTAGGQKVGGVGEGVGHSHSGGVHETATDKIKNVLPGQHNAHDAYGNPIKESTTGAHTSSSHTGSHTTGSGITGGSHQTHGSSNLTGTHGHSNVGGVTGSHNNYSHPNQPGSGFSSAAQPLGHDSSFADRHSGPGAGTGLAAGAVGGAGLAGATHHNTHNTHQTGSGLTGSHTGPTSTAPGSGFTGAHQDEYTRGQQAAYSQHGGSHNTTSGYAGEDNRGMMEKVKDKMSSKRSDQPDDPISGTNYDQKNREQYTQGSTGSHIPGSHTQSSGNHTYGSGTQQPGVGGITSGVDNTHIGSGNHSGVGSHTGATSGISHEGRGTAYEAGFKDAVAMLQGKK